MEFKLNEYHRNIPDEDLLEDIKRVANQLGKNSLTRDEYKKANGKYGINTITRRFGGWINAIELCGLSPTEKQTDAASATYTQAYISTEELLSDLVLVSNTIGKPTFTSKEYDSFGSFSSCTYYKRFKTWNNALQSAGLQPYKYTNTRISEYKLFEEIERIWIELGRQPTSTDIKNGVSRYSLHAYERRFGSWRKSLEAFVKYINGDYEIEITDEKENDENDENKTVAINYQQPSNKPVHKTKRDINLRMRFMVMQRDNFKCCICGASPAKDPSVELHIDHIIPWSKGGETTIDNLQTLCSKCNLGKSDLL
jgi:hypothetical protein